jgi:diadenosine tetraphosphatase ApaH/serine/threonine PP2A family protein phosphatase
MRYAILADIHSNLAALTAVLNDIREKGGVDEVWCLGDIVGYGPEPKECIKVLRECTQVCVSGNHDLGAAGKIDLDLFNPNAAEACRWTASQLSAAELLYLEELPKVIQKGDYYLVHGSPRDPLMEYIISTAVAQRNFPAFNTRYCFVGHTHVPMAYKEEAVEAVSAINLKPTIGLAMIQHRMIVNPGAVGQPRDGDPRASYGIYDTEGQMFRLYRVEYDIRATQDRMMEAGLPVPLVARLQEGR